MAWLRVYTGKEPVSYYPNMPNYFINLYGQGMGFEFKISIMRH